MHDFDRVYIRVHKQRHKVYNVCKRGWSHARAKGHTAEQQSRVEQLLKLLEVVLEKRKDIDAIRLSVSLRADGNVALELTALVGLCVCMCVCVCVCVYVCVCVCVCVSTHLHRKASDLEHGGNCAKEDRDPRHQNQCRVRRKVNVAKVIASDHNRQRCHSNAEEVGQCMGGIGTHACECTSYECMCRVCATAEVNGVAACACKRQHIRGWSASP
jgi:hypothetical protein